MTNQQAIYLLNNLRAFAEEDDDPAIDMAIESLQDDWIPVSEGLPEVGRSVLISDGVWTAEGCYRADGSWQQFRWDCLKEDVNAWKPLPEPYRESEE